MMQSEHTAPCPTTSLSLPALLWDTRSEISESELAALEALLQIVGGDKLIIPFC
ncbi:Uncharacterised protein [Escherichia coli]|nr:Uncharacterised protein [Escherichia coli]